jgi:hypothetical protein
MNVHLGNNDPTFPVKCHERFHGHHKELKLCFLRLFSPFVRKSLITAHVVSLAARRIECTGHRVKERITFDDDVLDSIGHQLQTY